MSGIDGWFTTFDDVELRTRTWQIDEPRYEVLIVHGLGEHCRRWDHVAEHFNRHGASAYTYDLRGHGESGGDRAHVDEMGEMHRDISAIAAQTAAASGRPWVLYGHSFGGMQVTGYLVDQTGPHPSLGVVSSPWLMPTSAKERFAASTIGVVSRIAPGLRTNYGIKGEALSRDPDVADAYDNDPYLESSPTVRFSAEAFAEMKRLEPLQASITTPTFVFHGAEDSVIGPQASAGLAASPAVDRKVYPRLRHECHNEPEGPEVLGDITDWIDARLSGS